MSPLLSSITVFNKKLFTFGVPGHLSGGLSLLECLDPYLLVSLLECLDSYLLVSLLECLDSYLLVSFPRVLGLLLVGLPNGVPRFLPVGFPYE